MRTSRDFIAECVLNVCLNTHFYNMFGLTFKDYVKYKIMMNSSQKRLFIIFKNQVRLIQTCYNYASDA